MVFLRLMSLSALALLASCWTPVFDENLSVAGLVRSKLTLEREITAVLNNGNVEGNVFQTVESHDSQLVIVTASTHTSVTEMQYEGFLPFLTNFGGFQSLDIPLSDPSQVILQPANFKVAVFLPTVPNGSGLPASASGNGAVKVFAPGISMAPLLFPDPSTATRTDLIGFSTNINPAQQLESFFLTFDPTGTALWQQVGDLDTTTALTPAPILGNIPYKGSAGWMAVDMSVPAIFLSHSPNSKGEYVTDVIDSTGLVTSWKGHDHVVALLSSGRLLTREGVFYNVCKAYDPANPGQTGKILYSFPAGSLQFAGEYWDVVTSSMRSRFSESLLMSPENGGQDEVRVRFYSIKTSKLDTLQ